MRSNNSVWFGIYVNCNKILAWKICLNSSSKKHLLIPRDAKICVHVRGVDWDQGVQNSGAEASDPKGRQFARPHYDRTFRQWTSIEKGNLGARTLWSRRARRLKEETSFATEGFLMEAFKIDLFAYLRYYMTIWGSKIEIKRKESNSGGQGRRGDINHE